MQRRCLVLALTGLILQHDHFKYKWPSRADQQLGWRLHIMGPDGFVFRTFSGELNDSSDQIWDGKGDDGKDYYSNYIYEFRLELVDKLGNQLRVDDDQKMRMVFLQ